MLRYKISIYLYWVVTLMFPLVISAQTIQPVETELSIAQLASDTFQHDLNPKRRLTPYFDALFGFSSERQNGFTRFSPTLDFRGGVYVNRSLLIGTGINFFYTNIFETIVILPVEIGYRSANRRWHVTSTFGYAFIPYDESDEGKTISADAYWRVLINRKKMKLTVGFGGLMYDFGDSDQLNNNCASCRRIAGPQFTYRVRVGIGF